MSQVRQVPLRAINQHVQLFVEAIAFRIELRGIRGILFECRQHPADGCFLVLKQSQNDLLRLLDQMITALLQP